MANRSNLAVQCCRCRNKHTEADREPRPHRSISCVSELVCPRCGCTSYYDITPWYAWCWASGLIEMGPTKPGDSPDGAGAIVIARGGKAHLEAVMQAVARHGQGASEGKLLVPGVPEADLIGRDPVDVLREFVDWCAQSNGRRHRHGVVFGTQVEG